MRERMREWEKLTASIDAAIGDEAAAMTTIGELALGLFPEGIPDFARLSWHDPLASAVTDVSPEAKLRAAEERYRTLVEQIPAVTFMAVLGEGANEIYVSPHIEAMLGYSQEEWLSDPFLWYFRLHPDDRKLWNDEFGRGCRTGGPFRADCRFLARDGHIVWVHGEARLVRDALGRPSFLQGVAFDITDIKRAQEAALAKTRLDEELAIARRVQMSIVPQSFSVPALDIAAVMIPAEQVGGDYYDVFPTNDGCWLAIGDVAGHGLDAGLVMLMVQASVATLTRTNLQATPCDILPVLNDVLFENIRRRLSSDAHVTFTLARFFDDGRMLFSGAHEDIVIVRADGKLELFRAPGTWLGARADITRVTVDALITLRPGDLVVLYTDGITETRNAAREQFDLPRLCDSVVRRRSESPSAIRDGVLADCVAWGTTQDDDRTLMVFRYHGRNS